MRAGREEPERRGEKVRGKREGMKGERYYRVGGGGEGKRGEI